MAFSVLAPPKRLWRKLDPSMRDRAATAIERFVANPSLPGLNFEKLAGYSDRYSIRISRGDRIVLRRIAVSDVFEILDIGPHDIYRRLGGDD